MSLKDTLNALVVNETVKMLANAPNAPQFVIKTVNEKEIKEDPPNVLPLWQLFGAGGIGQKLQGDYVFYNVSFRDDDYNKQFDIETRANADPNLATYRTKYNRELKIQWTFCGDDSFEWADTLRLMLLDPEIQSDFAAQGISLIPSVSEAVYAPESIGQQWLERYDMVAEFNQLVIYQSTIPAISGADVIIETENGEVAKCSVSAT